jgi:WXG100 family type VII secretion target
MTIEFTTPEFHASVAEVRRAAERLSAARSRASGEVSRLLDGWQGAAASEFAEAWGSWLRSSDAVVSALSGLSDALSLFQTDITQIDSGSATSLDALAGRLS